MPIVYERAHATEFGDYFGEYRGTFRSSEGQVFAYLFADNGELVAHVSFAPGYGFDNVTDPYLSELKRYATAQGFDERLRVIHADA